MMGRRLVITEFVVARMIIIGRNFKVHGPFLMTSYVIFDLPSELLR